MNRVRRLLAVALLTVIIGGVLCTGSIAADGNSVRHLIDVSEMSVRIFELLDFAGDTVVEVLTLARVSPGTVERMRDRVADVLVLEDFLDAIALELETHLTQDDVESLTTWYESDLGKRLTAAGNARSTVEEQRNMLSQKDALLQDAERVAIAQDLVALLDVTDATIAYRTNIGLLSAAAMGGIRTPGRPFDVDSWRQRMTPSTPRSEIEQEAIVLYVYLFYDFDLAELEQYKTELAAPHFLKSHAAIQRALNKQFERAALQLAQPGE